MPHVFATKKVLKQKGDPNTQPGKKQRTPPRKIIKRTAPPKPKVKQQVKRPTLRKIRGPAKGPLVVKKGGKPFQVLPEAAAFQMPFKSYMAPLLKDGQFVVSRHTGRVKKRGVVYPTTTSPSDAKIARGPTQVKDEQKFWREQKLVTGELSQGGLRTGSRTHQADTYGRLFKKDKIKPDEFTQITPGYYAYPESTGFNPARKWIKLKTKKVKTKTKLVAGKAPEIKVSGTTVSDKERMKRNWKLTKKHLKGTGSKKMDTFFGAGIAAGVGGAWEQFSDAISYNPLPYAAAFIGPSVAKKILKPSSSLDVTDSLKAIWGVQGGHVGRMNKFKNVGELDKRITYLDKELAAAKAGGTEYSKFKGSRGVVANWDTQAPSKVNPVARDNMAMHKFLIPKFDNLSFEQKRIIDDVLVVASKKTVGQETIRKIELEKMTLDVQRNAWDTQKEAIKTGADLPSKLPPGYNVLAESPTGTKVIGPGSEWMKSAMGQSLVKPKPTGKKGVKAAASSPPSDPKKGVTASAGAGMPKPKDDDPAAMFAPGGTKVIKLEKPPKPPSDDISIPGVGTIKGHSAGEGRKGMKKSIKWMGGAAATVVGIGALSEVNKVYPWFGMEQVGSTAPPGEQVAGTEIGASTQEHLENLGVTVPAVKTVEELLLEGNYKGAQDQALADRGLDAGGLAIQTTTTPQPGLHYQLPFEGGGVNPMYQNIQAARWTGGSIQTQGQWAKIGMTGVTQAQLEAGYLRQAKGQQLNALHADLNSQMNAKGGDLLARAEIAQKFYMKNSAMMGSLPSQYRTILDNRDRYGG